MSYENARKCLNGYHPGIAQLVERWTVEDLLRSIGRWFNSGCPEIFPFIVPLRQKARSGARTRD